MNPANFNLPTHSQTSDAGYKVATIFAILEAFIIIALLAFIFVSSLRRRRRNYRAHLNSGLEEGQQPEFAQTAPLMAHERSGTMASRNSNVVPVDSEPRRQYSGTRDYDPYEELENPSDMPRPFTPRPRLQSDVSRTSSGMCLFLYSSDKH